MTTPSTTTPLTASPPSAPAPVEPFTLSLNPIRPTTLIFLHGLTSSHLEWAHLLPHLTAYHLLLVDLPGHSRSSHLPGPYTIPLMADTIASVILHHAHSSRAHVIGLSMGGFVALELARRYPQLCLSVFATGAHPFERTYKFLASRPWIIFPLFWITHKMPIFLYNAMCDYGGMVHHEELRAEMDQNSKWEVISGVYASILESFGWEEVKALREVRILVVAGEKGDDVGSARGMARIWKEEGITEGLGSRIVVVRGAMHAWDLQMPGVFAEGVKAWVEGRELPGEFELLTG